MENSELFISKLAINAIGLTGRKEATEYLRLLVQSNHKYIKEISGNIVQGFYNYHLVKTKGFNDTAKILTNSSTDFRDFNDWIDSNNDGREICKWFVRMQQNEQQDGEFDK